MLKKKRAKPGPADEAAPRTAAGRKAAVIAAIAVLAVFLGALAGAHLALTSAGQHAQAKARDGLPAGAPAAFALAAIPEPKKPYETAAAPVARSEARTTSEIEEAALARLYEEAPEPAAVAGTAAAGPDAVQLAALPTPAPIEALVPARRPPMWLRNAVHVEVPPDRPMIAIVIDDLGLRRVAAHRAIELPAPLTLSFMTYAKGLSGMALAAREAGHELLLHVPMQPKSPRYDPGPKVLKVGMSRDQIGVRLRWGLARFDGFVGINNHMGSRFTSSSEDMKLVMRELRARDLLFLDSMTSGTSVGWKTAARAGVPFARRDVFLDHASRDPQAIRRQLQALEQTARRRGYAVGIGHPHSATLEVLAAWLPQARARGFALVPISAIVGHQIKVAQGKPGSAG